MERYPRFFLLASISYLLVGVSLGLSMSLDKMDPATGRFVHVHLNLLGFMAMFIYGVAYHILPRFNATPLKFPVLVPVHFYLVNAGLVGMVGSALANGVYGTGGAHSGFAVSGMLEATGILIFAYNIVPVLLKVEWSMPQVISPRRAPDAAPPAPPAGSSRNAAAVSAETKVAELIDAHPQTVDLLVASGLKTLAFPAARATFPKTTTIEQACKIHRIDTDSLLEKINAALNGGAPVPSAPKAATVAKKAADTMAKGKKVARGEMPVADTLVGSLIEAYPESKPVFEKHYGEGCFSCPGQAFETIAQTATMHGMKPEIILNEIHNSIKAVATPALSS